MELKERKKTFTDIRIPIGFCYTEGPTNRNRQDAVHDYCLCEKVDEDSVRYMINRIGRNAMNTTKQSGRGRALSYYLAGRAVYNTEDKIVFKRQIKSFRAYYL